MGWCRDKPSKPFRCLDPQYRRELVRVYLTNVEGVCRRFCDDKRARIMWAIDEASKFREFWAGLSGEQQRKLLSEKGEAILKVGDEQRRWWGAWATPGHLARNPGAAMPCGLPCLTCMLTLVTTSMWPLQGVVKQFFNEKEVTSTLVMDALYRWGAAYHAFCAEHGAREEASLVHGGSFDSGQAHLT